MPRVGSKNKKEPSGSSRVGDLQIEETFVAQFWESGFENPNCEFVVTRVQYLQEANDHVC